MLIHWFAISCIIDLICDVQYVKCGMCYAMSNMRYMTCVNNLVMNGYIYCWASVLYLGCIIALLSVV